MPSGKKTIEALTEDNEHHWKTYVRAHPNATIYHTLEWKKVLAESYGNLEPQYLFAKTGEGDIRGVLPLFKVDGILFSSRMESLPLSHIAGPLADDDETFFSLLEAACELSKEKNADFLELRLEEKIDGKKVVEYGFWELDEYGTVVLDLPKNSDVAADSLRRDRRRGLAKSREAGVTVREGASRKDFKALYDLLLEVRRTQGVPPYGFKFFENIRRFLLDESMAKLFIAEKDEAPLSALLVFNYNNTVTAGYGMGKKEKELLDYHGNDAAYFSAIEFASSIGAKTFDFGRCHKRQTSLIDYKISWGGREIQTPYYYFKNKPGKKIGVHHMSDKYNLPKKLWSKLPLGLTEIFGSRIFGRLI